MTLGLEESTSFLTKKLQNQEPFVFVKFGDGDLYWMAQNPVAIAGGETYRPGIDEELRKAADTLRRLPYVYFGDQLTCGSGPYLESEQTVFIKQSLEKNGIPFQLEEFSGEHVSMQTIVPDERWLHFECLLLHRQSAELLEFYRSIKQNQRTKAFIGGWKLYGASVMLGVNNNLYSVVDDRNAHAEKHRIAHLSRFYTEVYWDILLLSAGRASKLIAAALAPQFPDRTIIELGSALDPLFIGRTRGEQLDPEVAREFFKELL